MKAIVIGGAGFIGSHLVEELLEQRHSVVVMDNLSSGKRSIHGAEELLYDYGDSRYCHPDNFEDVDVIFYLATKAGQPSVVQASINNPERFNEENVGGFLRILNIASKRRIPIVFSSSSAVYGSATEPMSEDSEIHCMSPYALQKLICELYLALFNEIHGLPSVALRYFNVFGEGQPNGGTYATVIGKFLESARHGMPFVSIGTNGQKRDFVYVGDVVQANIKAAEALFNGKIKFSILNVGSGKNYSVSEIADIVTGNKTVWGERLPARLEPMETLADVSKIRKLLNWEPTKDLKSWLEQVRDSMAP